MITIFIHGTLPPKAICKLPIINNFFYCPEGLTLAKELNLSENYIYHLAQVPSILGKANSKKFDLDKFYLFGWSGKLSHKARLEAALELYKQLKGLNFNQVRIISHSHGGNVALNLKTIIDEHLDKDFFIDELILLACPVQKKTSELIKSDVFKKKYVFHSHADFIQILDPQGLYNLIDNIQNKKLEVGPIFSERHFERCSNIIHVKMASNKRPLLHVEFLLEKFLNFLPKALDIADSIGNSKNEISIDLDLD